MRTKLICTDVCTMGQISIVRAPTVFVRPLGLSYHSGSRFSLAGETEKAREAYRNLLAAWKNADPGIPILVAAKSEYAKLK